MHQAEQPISMFILNDSSTPLLENHIELLSLKLTSRNTICIRKNFHQKVPPGVVNIGSTCYASAIIQCLLVQESTRQALLSERSNSSLAGSFRRLLDVRSSNMDPSELLQKLQGIYYGYMTNKQEDVHEFLLDSGQGFRTSKSVIIEVSGKIRYRLTSVCNHSEVSPYSGHITTAALMPNSDEWYLFDDTFVKRTDPLNGASKTLTLRKYHGYDVKKKFKVKVHNSKMKIIDDLLRFGSQVLKMNTAAVAVLDSEFSLVDDIEILQNGSDGQVYLLNQEQYDKFLDQ
ncbi:hypothetical protein HK096_000752 [Nowakowskiella sp. JEL0078]|nr:hypothetical protein HK096_000752 [Nowakowskiella sp. JEL0078]